MAKVKLNKQFYSKQSLKQAIKEYSSIATLKLKEQGGYYYVDIKPAGPEYKSIINDEFANYVLALNKR